MSQITQTALHRRPTMFASLSRQKKHDRRRSTVHLSLEQLEGRALPSTFTVLNLNDSGAGSLRLAVQDANATPAADKIVFAPGVGGTIALTGGELRITHDLAISGPGADRLTVSGNDASRVFQIAHNSTVSIAGLTLAHGLAEQGGAVFNGAHATLTISNCSFRDNLISGSTSDVGGGALWNAGDVAISDTTFVGNHAVAAGYGSGGAIANFEGTLTITRSSFTENKGFGGTFPPAGAIDNYNGEVTIADSTFAGNQAIGSAAGAEASGGAIYNYNDSPRLLAIMNITNSTFIGNSSVSGMGKGAEAGAIASLNGKLTLNHSLFIDNQAISGPFSAGDPVTFAAGTVGGGIYVDGGVSTVTKCSFIDNKVLGGAGGAGGGGQEAGGGAIGAERALVTITGSTFSGNSAIGGAGGSGATGGLADGGAIDLSTNATVIISNSTFTNNLAVGGTGGSGARGGAGYGGAIAVAIGVLFGRSDASSLTVDGCTFENNTANGGNGGAGGIGGDGLGGALAVLGEGSAELRCCLLDGNQAIGGHGQHGGNGLGGGVYVADVASVSVKKSSITHNWAKGGDGDDEGQGVGGGVYSLGAFVFDALTGIEKNHASTSDDDVFA